MEVLFATSNPHKVAEANKVGADFGVVFSQVNILYPEVRADSVRKVAEEGVKYVHGRIQKPVIVEDSGLFVDSLDGFPGTYSAYVYKKIGCEGILKLLVGQDNRRARFVSAIGYSDKRGTKVFEGQVKGFITEEPIGDKGFGYDPVFKSEDNPKTFSQDPKHKNMVSHRRKATEEFCRYVTSA